MTLIILYIILPMKVYKNQLVQVLLANLFSHSTVTIIHTYMYCKVFASRTQCTVHTLTFSYIALQGFRQDAAKNGELCGTMKVNCAANCAAVNS